MEWEVATHFSILPWKIPWTEEPGRLQSWGRKESDTIENKDTKKEKHNWGKRSQTLDW